LKLVEAALFCLVNEMKLSANFFQQPRPNVPFGTGGLEFLVLLFQDKSTTILNLLLG